MMKRSTHLILGAAAIFGLVSSAQATIIVSDYYRLGEADSPAAVSGGPGDISTKDSAGSNNLSPSGAPTYSNDVGISSSTFSMNFNGFASYSGSPVLTGLTSNFGMEILVKPTVASESAVLFYNGNGNGWGITLSGGKAELLYGGQGTLDAPSALPLNVWSEVAITRMTGGPGENLYVNGVLVNSSSTNSPTTPTGFLVMGESAAGTSHFTGLLDEAKVFTFSTGGFSTTDLAPEPASLTLLAIAAAGLLTRRRQRR